MLYKDFAYLMYQPKEDDIICDFFIEPMGIDMEGAAVVFVKTMIN